MSKKVCNYLLPLMYKVNLPTRGRRFIFKRLNSNYGHGKGFRKYKKKNKLIDFGIKILKFNKKSDNL
jgi:hypothetical protein